MLVTCLLPTMPKTKSSRHGRRSAQGPVRRSTRQATRVSTRSSSTAGTTSQPETLTSPAQHDSLAGQSLSDLLSLVREQVRAKVQAQQASTGQDGQHSLGTSTTGSPQMTISAQSTTTMTQPATGTSLCVNRYTPGYLGSILPPSPCNYQPHVWP